MHGSLPLGSFTSALGAVPAFFWDHPFFAHDGWTNTMNGLRILLTAAGALMLIYELRAVRLGELGNVRLRKRIAIGMAVLGFGAYFDFFNPNVRYDRYYHRHEFFHYYLGSKYNRELEYTRLYECTAIAEVELGRAAQVRKRELRDLSVNLIKPTTETFVFSDPAQCKSHFSPATWEAFKKDVDWFYHSSPGDYWLNMQKDHGYNPPPVWTMEGKLFSSLGVAGDTFFKQLASIDIMLHLGMVLLVFWAFGWRVGAAFTVFWGCNAPANFYWTGGAFLRQDWLFFLVASSCFARKRKYGLAGAALTWSTALRVFPVVLFAGPAILIAIDLIKRRRLSLPYKRFIGGAIVAGGLLVPASVVIAGPQSYYYFYKHIMTHKSTPLTNTMGLETMIVHNWDGRMRFTRDDNLDDPFEGWKNGRTERIHEHRWLFRGIILFVGLWTVWALRRTKSLWISIGMGVPLLSSVLNLTCYYFSFFLVLIPLMKARRPLGPLALLASAGSQIVYLRYYWVDDKFTAMSWLFYAFALLALFAYSRPFSLGRLRAWLAGDPEPRPAAPPPPKLAGAK